jgi:hypothetical protein
MSLLGAAASQLTFTCSTPQSSQSCIMTEVSQPICLGVWHQSRTYNEFVSFVQLFLDSYRFVDVGLPF